VTATGLLLLLGGVASVLLHGQVALNVLILFATIAFVQRLYRWLPGGNVFADARSLAVPTVLFGAFYVLWASRYEIVYVMFDNVYTAVEEWVQTGQGGAETVQQTSGSASEIGVSIVELFMKLFFVKTVFVALAAILALVALTGRLDGADERNEAVTYFAYGGLVLGPFFLAHFLGNVSRYFFRHVGFGMVIATILGAVMIHSFYRAVADGRFERPVRTLGVVAVVVGLLLSLVVVFPSPYIFLPTNGLSEQMHDGYNTSFTYNDSDLRYVDVRGGAPQRYQDALRGPVILSWGQDLTEENMTQDTLTNLAPDPYYLPVSDYDYKREVGAYRGGTFSATALNSIGDESGVSRSLSNGGIAVYYVDSSDPPQPDTGGGEQAGGDGGDDSDGGVIPSVGTDGPSNGTEEPAGTPFPEVPAGGDEAPGGNETGGDATNGDGGGGANDSGGGDAGTGTESTGAGDTPVAAVLRVAIGPQAGR
jgi:hypothetical protein